MVFIFTKYNIRNIHVVLLCLLICQQFPMRLISQMLTWDRLRQNMQTFFSDLLDNLNELEWKQVQVHLVQLCIYISPHLCKEIFSSHTNGFSFRQVLHHTIFGKCCGFDCLNGKTAIKLFLERILNVNNDPSIH